MVDVSEIFSKSVCLNAIVFERVMWMSGGAEEMLKNFTTNMILNSSSACSIYSHTIQGNISAIILTKQAYYFGSCNSSSQAFPHPSDTV